MLIQKRRDLTFTGLDAAGFKLRCFPLLALDLVCTKARVIPPWKAHKDRHHRHDMTWIYHVFWLFSSGEVRHFDSRHAFQTGSLKMEDGSCPGTEEADKIQKFWGKPFGINCWAPRSLRKWPLFMTQGCMAKMPLPSAFFAQFCGCKDLGMTSWPSNAQFHVVMMWFLPLFFYHHFCHWSIPGAEFLSSGHSGGDFFP